MKKLNGYELLELVREVNSYDGSLEEYYYYSMDELDGLFCDTKPSDLLNMVAGEFNIFDDYFTIDVYGHLVSYCEYEVYEELEQDQGYILEVYKEIKEFL